MTVVPSPTAAPVAVVPSPTAAPVANQAQKTQRQTRAVPVVEVPVVEVPVVQNNRGLPVGVEVPVLVNWGLDLESDQA